MIGESTGKILPGRPGTGWEDNISMDLDRHQHD